MEVNRILSVLLDYLAAEMSKKKNPADFITYQTLHIFRFTQAKYNMWKCENKQCCVQNQMRNIFKKINSHKGTCGHKHVHPTRIE